MDGPGAVPIGAIWGATELRGGGVNLCEFFLAGASCDLVPARV